MVINTTLTKKELIRLNIALLFRRNSTYLIIIVLSVLLVVSLLNASTGDVYGLTGWTIVFLYFIGYYAFIIYRHVYSKANSKWFLPTTYEINDHEVVSTTSVDKEVYQWPAFVKWVFVADCYLLYISRSNFLIIKSSEIVDKKSFETLLMENIKVQREK